MRVRWPLYNIPFVKTGFLLSKDAVLHGPLQADCGGRIDGLVKGYVTVTGRLTIGKTAEIKGDVTARAVRVAGRVYGNIACGDIVIVYNTAVIKGDITAKIILVKEGAQVEGIITKHGDPADAVASLEETDTAVPEVEEVVVAPTPSTDKDKDATNWF